MLAQYNTPDGGAGAASIIFLLVWLGVWALVVWGTWRVATNNGRNGGLAVVLGIFFRPVRSRRLRDRGADRASEGPQGARVHAVPPGAAAADTGAAGTETVESRKCAGR